MVSSAPPLENAGSRLTRTSKICVEKECKGLWPQNWLDWHRK